MPTSWQILDLPDLHLRTPYTVLPRPNAIDKWLSGNYVTPPGNVFALGYRYMGDLLSDQVLCTLQLSTSVVHCDNFFTDIIKYRLALYVQVPETSAVDVTDLISPIATLGCYEGLCSDADAPDWTRMPPGKPVELRQPRDAMVNVFTEIAFWPENANIPHMSPAILNWVAGVSNGLSQESKPPPITLRAVIPMHHAAKVECRRSTRRRRQTERYSSSVTSTLT